MVRIISLIFAAVVLVSCGESPNTPAEAVSVPQTRASNAPNEGLERIVELTPEALKNAHITWEEATSRTVHQTVRAPGRLMPNEDRVWRIGAITEGLVVQMNANVDDYVRSGQVLARMHSHAVHDGRADYVRAKNDLATIETRHSYLKSQAARVGRLLELKAASVQQLQQAESDVRDAEGLVQNARTEVERARVHLVEFLHVDPDIHDSNTKVEGYDAADLIPILAFGAGTVLERPVSPGTVVQAGQSVYVISDLSSLWMIAEVPQQQLSALREGMRVAVRSQAYPDEAFQGRITRIGAELNAATRTVNVRIELPNPRRRLRPEMYADAEIAAGETDEGVFVRQSAVQDLHGQSVVFVKSGDTSFTLRPVETGAALDGLRRILIGVQPGDQVVVDGSFILKSKLLEASLAEE